MGLTLTWWQAILFWPGIVFMDWLARAWPDVVIRYDFGFTVDSYLYWAMLVSVIFWSTLLLALIALVRHLRTSRKSRP